jgi:hypothetical protein
MLFLYEQLIGVFFRQTEDRPPPGPPHVNPVLCTCAAHDDACAAYSQVRTRTTLTHYYINTHSREMHAGRPGAARRKQVGRSVTKCGRRPRACRPPAAHIHHSSSVQTMVNPSPHRDTVFCAYTHNCVKFTYRRDC